MADTNEGISLRIQEKFEFYFLSLTFVLLGLSIQTAKLGVSSFSDSFELIGWLSLLVSGLVGLSRMEWIPCSYRAFHEKQQKEKLLNAATARRDLGQNNVPTEGNSEMPIEEFIEQVTATIDDLGKTVIKINKRNSIKYLTHKYAFFSA